MTFNITTNFGRIVGTADTKEEAEIMAWKMDCAAYDRGVRGAHFEVAQ